LSRIVQVVLIYQLLFRWSWGI